MKELTKAALNSSKTHKSKDARKDGNVTRYCATVSHLINTYTSGDIIAAAKSDLFKSSQPDRMSEEDYAADLYKKALRYGSIYPEERLKGLSIEGLHSIVMENVRNYYDKKG